MSPLNLRRYRAEKLLREQFEALRGRVISAVRAKLRGHGATLDESDFESAYSQAWQGLYAALLSGEEIHNPGGWLTLVTYRRAIDELRGRRVEVELQAHTAADDRDLEADIDDRRRLRELMEGMGSRLTDREREAAALCYLQGLSRAEAAQRMGIAPRRMKRLMEGRGPGRPGVVSKMGALSNAIANGSFCDEQASLMRALAFGMLDPEGERYKIANAHRRSCPACRTYVLSLRGLSAALPPVFLPGLLDGLRLGGGSGAVRGASVAGGGPATGAGGPVAGVGAIKLTVVGALLIGAVAGTAVLIGSSSHRRTYSHAPRPALESAMPAASRDDLHRGRLRSTARESAHSSPPSHSASTNRNQGSDRQAPLPSAASREFGIERWRSASGHSQAATPAEPTAGSATPVAPARPSSAGAARTQREFGIE